METKLAYESKLQAQLDKWSADIDKLKAKADEAGADARIELRKQIDDLEHQREQAREKFDRLKRAGDDAWEDLKDGADLALKSLDNAIRSARARF